MTKGMIDINILKNICDELRAKTGSINKIQVKNIPNVIKNLPSSSVSFNTSLTLNVDEENEVTAVLKAKATETGSNIINNGLLSNAFLELQGVPAYATKSRYIGKYITDENGAISTRLNEDYEELTINFNGSEMYNSSSKSVPVVFIPKMTLKAYVPNKQLDIQPISQDTYKTYLDGVEIPNITGHISKTLPAGTGPYYTIDYKGDFTGHSLNSSHSWTNIIKAVLPVPIENIEYAFYNNEYIEEIIFKGGGEVLPYDTIYDCMNLKHVRLPDTLISINDNFNNCPNLLDLIIPASLKDGFNSSFDTCDNIAYICLENGLEGYVDFKLSNNLILEHICLAGAEDIGTILDYSDYWLNDKIVKFARFNHETKDVRGGIVSVKELKRLDFPVSCKNITREITPYFTMESVPKFVKFWCVIPPRIERDFVLDNDVIVKLPALKEYDKEQEMIEGFRDMLSRTGASYSDVVIDGESGHGVVQIGFTGESLEIINTSSTNLFWDLELYNDESFINGDVIEFTVTDGNKDIVLNYLKDIENVFLINGYFTSINLPVFKDNKQLTEFIFPTSLEYVCDEAFMNCENLRTLIFYCPPPEMSSNSFKGLSDDCKVYVPATYYIDFKRSFLNEYNIIPFADSVNEAELTHLDDYMYQKTYNGDDLDYDNAKNYFEAQRPA